MSKRIILNSIGRARITSAFEPTGNIKQDKEVIVKMLRDTIFYHRKNVQDMDILKSFYDNKNTIIKDKKMRQDIDNYVEVPDVYRITRDLNGHICGSGVIFSDITGKYEEEITEFNSFLRATNFDSCYLKANKNASLYGVGYYYVEPNNTFDYIKSPYLIEAENLDPRHTYCVYSNDIIPHKIWAVWYNKIKTTDRVERIVYNVWSKYAVYTFMYIDGNYNEIQEPQLLAFNQIPIIEVSRNEDRIGDSELALSLIQAKNMLFSNRVDDVQQVVDYVYLLYNLSLGTDSDGNELEGDDKKNALYEVLKSRVIQLNVTSPTIQPKVEILKNPLNQTEIQTLADYLDSVINVVCALPDRSVGTSNNDTGVANDYKLGFRSLESYADTVTSFIKKSLLELIYVIIAITQNSGEFKSLIGELDASDIDIKPQRNTIFSLTDTANAYSTLRSAGLNDEDAIKITGVSQDIPETSRKNKVEADEKAQQEQQANQVAQENIDITTDSND